MWNAVCIFFSWVVSLITGKSAQEKLGQAETQNADMKAELKEVHDARTIDSRVDGMSDSDVDKVIRKNGWEH